MTGNNSRFSSLKVFRFPSKAEDIPPPPPPKDPYYLHNRSLASLLPESLPGSPLSSQYAQRLSPGAYQSTMSLTSPAPSVSPTSVADSSAPRGPRRGGSIFRFAKRGPNSPSNQNDSPKSPSMPDQPSLPTEDENISMPWNFQHHTHVDETLSGLPPSWSASLAESGFSEEEITAIRARRAAARLRSSQDSLTGRPFFPLPVLTHPTPRSTSLPRQFIDPTSQPSPHLPSHPSAFTGSGSTPLRKYSTESNNPSPSSSTLDISREADLQYSNVSVTLENGHDKQSSSSSHHSLNHTRSRRSSSISVTDFPPAPAPALSQPQRVFHVVNGVPSPPFNSPPPSYSSAAKTTFTSTDLPPSRTSPGENGHSESLNPKTNAPSKLSTKNPAGLPPRLSLHENTNDLLSWSEALLSALPSDLSPPSMSPLNNKSPTNRPGRPPPPVPLPMSALSSPKSDLPSGDTPDRLSSQSDRSFPSIILKEYNDDDESSLPPHTARSPLWDELMGMVQEASPSSYAPALNESLSPTLPTSPSEGDPRFSVDSYISKEEIGYDQEENDDNLLSVGKEHISNRDSNTSIVSTATVTAATIVQNVSVAKRATASFFDPMQARDDERKAGSSATSSISAALGSSPNLDSPMGSNFSSNDSSGSGSSSLPFQDHQPQSMGTKIIHPPHSPVYLDFLDSPPLAEDDDLEPDHGSLALSRSSTFGLVEKDNPDALINRQTIVVNCDALPSPLTPDHRYRGWLSEVVAPLEAFIDHHRDPRKHYVDLQEIAEGESGSVYAARVVDSHRLLFPIMASRNHGEDDGDTYVAIKNVPILPSGSPKLNDLERELTLMKGVRHEHVLGMDALYVDLVEDSLWIRMELMERSLADVVSLVDEGLMVQERMIARFASDVLLALAYLQEEGIAHRDLRSDNLLLNISGVLKIADFSNAVRVTAESPMRSDIAGVIYWQAPEMRRGSYNVLKVDVWSLGATVWEMAQAKPPFSDVQDPRKIGDQWPPLSQPEIYSRSFHEFLRLCSQPASLRPDPGNLTDTAFIRNACGRPVIIQLLSQCRALEERAQQEAIDS